MIGACLCTAECVLGFWMFFPALCLVGGVPLSYWLLKQTLSLLPLQHKVLQVIPSADCLPRG